MKPAASTQSNGGPKMPMAMLNFLCAMDHMAGKKPAAEASAPVGCAVGNAGTCTASQIEGATSGSALPAHGTPIEHTEAAATTAGCCASPGCTGSLPPVITGAGSGRTWSIRDRYKRYEQPISREEADALRSNSPSPPALNISQAPDSSASHPRVKLPFAPQPTPDASTKQKVNRSRYAGRCMTLTPGHPDYFLLQDSSDDDDEMPDLVPDSEPPLVRENHDTGASEEEESEEEEEEEEEKDDEEEKEVKEEEDGFNLDKDSKGEKVRKASPMAPSRELFKPGKKLFGLIKNDSLLDKVVEVRDVLLARKKGDDTRKLFRRISRRASAVIKITGGGAWNK